MLTSAVAAGVTSTFGCPFGGVIFSIEVTSTFYNVSNLWKAFFCATSSIVAFRFFHLSHYLGSFKHTDFSQIELNHEIFLYALLGSLCGLLAGVFNHVLTKLIFFRTKLKAPFASSRY